MSCFSSSTLPLAVFVLDAAGSPFYANPAARDLLGEGIVPGTDPQQPGDTYQAFLAGSDDPYPPDRTPVVRALGGETGAVRDMEVRHPDRTLQLEVWATPIRDDEGAVRFAMAAFRDVTEQMRLKAEVERKTTLLEVVQEVLIAANEASTFDDALGAAVHAVCSRLGWTIGHVYLPTADGTGELNSARIWHLPKDSRFESFRHVTDATRLRPGMGLVGAVMATRMPKQIVDVTRDPTFLRSRAASDANIKSALAFPALANGEVCAVLEFFSTDTVLPDDYVADVLCLLGTQVGKVLERRRTADDLTRWAVEMHEMTLVDELTQLQNRRGFSALVTQQLSAAQHSNQPHTFLFIDIDGLKKINDTWGHDAGDKAISATATLLKDTFRTSDVVGRVGGDEFCVLLVGTPLDKAQVAVAHLQDAITERNAKTTSPFSLSLSIGVEPYDPQAPISYEDLVARADAAMYTHKLGQDSERS